MKSGANVMTFVGDNGLEGWNSDGYSVVIRKT